MAPAPIAPPPVFLSPGIEHRVALALRRQADADRREARSRKNAGPGLASYREALRNGASELDLEADRIAAQLPALAVAA